MVSGLLLSDTHRTLGLEKPIKNMFLTVCFLICIEPVKFSEIMYVQFPTFYFLICIEHSRLAFITYSLFLTFYFLICVEPEEVRKSYGYLFLTTCFLICIEPRYGLRRVKGWLLIFYFLINTNIPSLP